MKKTNDKERTVGDVMATLNKDQEKAVLLLLGQVCKDAEERGYKKGLSDAKKRE